MKLFVDASALVAILARESEKADFADRIDRAEAIFSPMVRWETVSALCRMDRNLEPEVGGHEVDAFARSYGISMVPLGGPEAELAVVAFARYGKGRHPAQLNMGDCFAYACTKTNNARLLYKGDDFSKTDLA